MSGKRTAKDEYQYDEELRAEQEIARRVIVELKEELGTALEDQARLLQQVAEQRALITQLYAELDAFTRLRRTAVDRSRNLLASGYSPTGRYRWSIDGEVMTQPIDREKKR